MLLNLAAGRDLPPRSDENLALRRRIEKLERDLAQLRAVAGMPAIKCPEYPTCFAHTAYGCSTDRGCPFAFYAGDEPCRCHEVSGCTW